MQHSTDIDLTANDIGALSSPDALAAFFTRLGYPTGARRDLTAAALSLSQESQAAIDGVELLAADESFRVLLVQVGSLTAKLRNELTRKLGQTGSDHLFVHTSDFETLEFVLVDRRRREPRGPTGVIAPQPFPRVINVHRRSTRDLDRRILRGLTWTSADGFDQYEKLRGVFESAAFMTDYFQNRALFADHYLTTRLPEDPAWGDDPAPAFMATRDRLQDARRRWSGQPEQTVRDDLYKPLWELLGFSAKVNKAADKDHLEPDYLLNDADGTQRTVAFVYRWGRWLDGPDPNDADTPDENPGAAVVSKLNEGAADWAIVTNGKLWRLYSKDAHSRSTNFYEVDLEAALTASGETDPNEAFRYWWLFFRCDAFQPVEADGKGCWLDTIVQGSREYAKRLGDRLKSRVFVDIFPHLAHGFLADRERRPGIKTAPTEAELSEIFEAALTLLYRLLFLLYAEARDLLPIRESPYARASLKRIKEEVAEHAGTAPSSAAERLTKAYDAKGRDLYDRLTELFRVIDEGDKDLNVPCYNGGLFITKPLPIDDREHRLARFLNEHKIPDRHVALAIDRVARDEDEKTCGLVFIDYKSLEVRHLGSIYEGLLEFKIKIAEEDLTTTTEKKREKYLPLSAAKPKRGRRAGAVVKKGEVYLSNDKAERKATGSYYTPDPIVEYIVEHTVGPVLAEKLDGLRDGFRNAGRTFHKWLKNFEDNPAIRPAGRDARSFAAEKTYAEHKGLVDRLFDLKVLDPAMGSGHFLVEAVDFITDRVLDFLNRFPNNPVNFALERTRGSILGSLGRQGVEIDPAKLTDVNLLKRHVLKRCIYGVDLNPMAVELAKVSLWLDAFTLGAPLSFLDHHLRCGNSLIGATFKDLEKATEGQLFKIDYSPLLDAIRNVLFVNAMADATADEVKESVSRYADARTALSGYKIVFDLLVADHFLEPSRARKEADSLPPSQGRTTGGSSKGTKARRHKATKGQAAGPRPSSLLTHASDLDLSTREAFVKSLGFKSDREMVAAVEELADRPDRRFFHWEIEFPEVFFNFEDADQRRVKHRDEIGPGFAGFDAVIGNPPYVRQESIAPLKAYLKAQYATFDSTNDLYVYFQEREVAVLRAGGRMGMIVANKWMRAGYGKAVRRFLQRVAQPLSIIDFGHSPIFPDADTFPCIPIVARRGRPLSDISPVPDAETATVCSVPREHWDDQLNLSAYVAERHETILVRLLRDDGWFIEDERVHALLAKLTEGTVRLSEFVRGDAYFGIKTGLNQAYYLDVAQRDALISADVTCAPIIRPLVRGRDLRRWLPAPGETFLIALASSGDANWPWANAGTPMEAERAFQRTYPSIYAHLLPHRKSLERRTDRGKYWWELRSCAYYHALHRPKIVLKRIAFHSQAAIESTGAYVNDSTTFIGSESLYILGILNSRLMWWLMTRVLAHKKDEALAMDSTRVDNLPMAPQDGGVAVEIVQHVTHALELSRSESMLLQRLKTKLADTIGVQLESDHVERLWQALPQAADTFSDTVQRYARIRELSNAQARRVRAIRAEAARERAELVHQQIACERRVDDLVADAYGLTPDEREILCQTRPMRDPIDVLEAKVAGLACEIDDAVQEVDNE